MSLTKKQLEARALACGASEISALAGVSRWTSPIEIFDRKVKGDEFAGNLATDLGDLLEEPIAKLAAKETGLIYMRVDTLTDESKPYAVATPDRAGFTSREGLGDLRRKLRTQADLAGALELLQVKHTTMRLRHEWGRPGSDGVPDYYYTQAIWECATAEVKRDTFAVLFDKAEFALFPVDANPDLFAGLYEIAERFFVDHVIPRRPPPPDLSDAYSAWLDRQFPTSSKKLVEPSTELESKILQWARLKAGEKRCKQLAKGITNELKAALGEDYGFTSPHVFGKVCWIRTKPRSSTKWAAAFDELLKLFDQLSTAKGDLDRAKIRENAHEIVKRHTVTAPGASQFKLFPGESALADLGSQPLELSLSALEAGEVPEENEEAAA